MSAAVKIVGLTKYYGDFLAVDHIDLEIHEGEIFGFLGPNGAGKTTTLLMLTTVLKPSDGTAYVYGYDIRNESDRVRELIGMAFQDPKLYWIHSPWEILLWHAKVCGYRGGAAKRVVEDVLKELDMWDARKKKAFELSGGMRKRVEIAKLFIQRPKLAIFDEPTTQIDVSGKHKIWDMIKELRDAGSTIILATNELYEADILSDRIAIIFQGRIVAEGTPKELKDSIPGGDILEIQMDDSLSYDAIDELYGIEEVSEVKYSDNFIKVYLNRVEEVLPHILEILMNRGVRVKSVNMREPSLDDVFLHYTGKSIREAEEVD
jgi:ABC-2 type transport system ATP-binding protein